MNKITQMRPDDNYPWDAAGIAAVFADRFQDELRYNRTARTWLYYDGIAWKTDHDSLIAARKAKQLHRELISYCSTIPDDKRRDDYLKVCKQLSTLQKRESVIRDAREIHFLDRTDLDQQTVLLNCLNGTFDLSTFKFREHRPSDLITKTCGANYDPNATSELFIRFVDQIMCGNSEKAGFLQRYHGYALTGTAKEAKALWEYGPTTRNGKSTFNYIMLSVFGDYGLSMQPETLAQRKRDSSRPSGDIARLNECRFLNVTEPAKNMLIDSQLLKQLTGNGTDGITARHLNEKEFTFLPKFTLAMNCNYLPFIDDATVFESNRIFVLTFDRHFTEQERDPDLKNKLTTPENLSGVLNWLLDGLRMYQSEGLNPPESVRKAMDEYSMSADEIGLFIRECLVRSSKNITAVSAYKRYCDWCRDNSFGQKTKNGFFDALREKKLFLPTGTVNGQTFHNVIPGHQIIGQE